MILFTGPSIGQGVSPIVNHNKASDNANNISMPGPSNRMSFVASTPQVGNCISNSTENPSKTTMNGMLRFSHIFFCVGRIFVKHKLKDPRY